MRCDVASRARVSLAPPASCARRSECVPQYEYTALIAAAINGHAEVIALLLKAGADVEAKDKVSRAPSRPAPLLARTASRGKGTTHTVVRTHTRTHARMCMQRARGRARVTARACLCEWCNARVAACCACDGRQQTADGRGWGGDIAIAAPVAGVAARAADSAHEHHQHRHQHRHPHQH